MSSVGFFIYMETKIGALQHKNINVEIKNVNEDDFVIEAIVATSDTDRHGEVVSIDGMETDEYMKNPIVGWAHDYTIPPVAKTIELRKVGNNLLAKMKFAVKESDFARQIYELYKGGFLKAFSVGFVPLEAEGNVFTKSKLLEYSAVLIPANPNALALAKSKGIDVDSLNQITKPTSEAVKGEELETKGGEYENMDKKTEKKTEKVEKVEKSTETPVTLEAIGELVDSKLKSFKEEIDAPVKKNINTKKETTVEVKSVEMPKEEQLKAWVKAMVTKDFTEYREIMQKAGMTTSNTSAVVPPTEFVNEVLRLEEDYGVARRFATVRRTDRTSITWIKGANDVSIFDTAEAGVKKSTTATYSQFVLNFRKFAAIAPLTDELLEDSAIDLWNDLTQRFARAFARREDELVFTEVAAGGNTNNGIINETGVVEVAMGSEDPEDITFDALNRMVYGVPSSVMANGRFFIHRSLLGAIQRVKDDQGRYIWTPGANGPAEGTIWGLPYTLTEVLPTVADGDGVAYAVFGDLRNVVLGERTAMQARIFDTGLVNDPADDQDDAPVDQLNLLTQDMQALRVVKRMNAKVVFPDGFSILVPSAS